MTLPDFSAQKQAFLRAFAHSQGGEEEQLDALRRVWPRLSEADQLLLSGRYILGLDDRELARLAGCKPGSVRMKLTRARRNALREMKKERCIDDESEQTDN